MALLALSTAALVALALPAALPAERSFAVAARGVRPVARRSMGGASATAAITARIISGSARIGAGLPPPAGLAPRAATVTAADDSAVEALIYDFE